MTESFNNIAYTSLSPSCGLHDVTGDDDKMDGDLPKPPATNPDHCIKGTGPEGLGYLCEFVCKYDYCLSPCKCEKTGGLVTAPSPDAKPGKAQPGQPEGVGRLCAFSCSRRFCPPAACIAAEDSSDTCDSDPQEAQAWEDSGAASLVDNYIKGYGNGTELLSSCGLASPSTPTDKTRTDDWLRGADVRYHLGSDESGLNCDSISSNHCPAPQGACSSWKEPSCELAATQMLSSIYYFLPRDSNRRSLVREAHGVPHQRALHLCPRKAPG